VAIELVRGLLAGKERARLLDIGCSTGNLLRHLRSALPELELTGGDLTPDVLARCRADPELEGVEFAELDVLALPEQRFDAVVANAVLFLLTDDEFARAAGSIKQALRPGGALVAFDLFHPFEQELEVRERSRTHPDGLVLHLRPYERVRDACEAAGFERIEFHPFEIPVDLPRNDDDGELITYTRRTDEGGRLLFRGALVQPWCHMVATAP
jgi:SAM-dependent methyltransferase